MPPSPWIRSSVVQLFARRSTRSAARKPGTASSPRRSAGHPERRRDRTFSEARAAALAELEASDLFTAIASRIKEELRSVRQARSRQAARWRITDFLRHASGILDPDPILDPIRKALATVETPQQAIRSAGRHGTAMPVSKGSTACSRPPGPLFADIATSQHSRP